MTIPRMNGLYGALGGLGVLSFVNAVTTWRLFQESKTHTEFGRLEGWVKQSPKDRFFAVIVGSFPEGKRITFRAEGIMEGKIEGKIEAGVYKEEDAPPAVKTEKAAASILPFLPALRLLARRG